LCSWASRAGSWLIWLPESGQVWVSGSCGGRHRRRCHAGRLPPAGASLRDFRHIGRKSCFFSGFPLTRAEASDRLTLSGQRAGRFFVELSVPHLGGRGMIKSELVARLTERYPHL